MDKSNPIDLSLNRFKLGIIQELLQKWNDKITAENYTEYHKMAEEAADALDCRLKMLDEAHYYTLIDKWPDATPEWYSDYVKWLYIRGIEKEKS